MQALAKGGNEAFSFTCAIWEEKSREVLPARFWPLIPACSIRISGALFYLFLRTIRTTARTG